MGLYRCPIAEEGVGHGAESVGDVATVEVEAIREPVMWGIQNIRAEEVSYFVHSALAEEAHDSL